MTGQARQGAAAIGSGPLRFFCRGPHRRAAIKAAPTRTDTLSVGRGLAPAAVPQGPNTSRPRRRKVRSRRDALAWASLPPLPCSSSPQPPHCVGLGWGAPAAGRSKNGAAANGSAPCGSFGCHASHPPPRRTAHRSAKNSLCLRHNCFFVCAARCTPAPGHSALRLT